MSIINCEINLILSWSGNCFIIDNPVENQVPRLTITNTKLFVIVVTLSIPDNTKLLQQLKSGFKRTTNWNKYQSKVTVQKRNRHWNYFIDPIFQRVHILFVFSFENNGDRASSKSYYLPQVEIKDYNVMTDERNLLIQLVKNNLRTIYDNIWKIETRQGDDYTTGCLLDYLYFKTYYKLIAIDLSKQQELDAELKAIKHINSYWKSRSKWKYNNVFYY